MKILKNGRMILEIPAKWQLDSFDNDYNSFMVVLKALSYDLDYFIKYRYLFNCLNNNVNINIGVYKDSLELNNLDVVLNDLEAFAAYNMCEILRI